MFKILIVDDDKISTEGICRLIKDRAFDLEPITAHSGKQALDILADEHIDILFTDIKMPVMNGHELIKEAMKLNPNLKVAIFSAYGEFEYARIAMQLGVKHYLLKPIKVDKFYEIIDTLLDECKADNLDKWRGIIFEEITNSSTLKDAVSVEWRAGRMVLLLELTKPLFSGSILDLDAYIQQKLQVSVFTVIVNEYQAVLFIDVSVDVQHFAQKLLERIDEEFSQKSILIVGKAFSDLDDFKKLYAKMENLTETKFFISDNTILPYDTDFVPQAIDVKEYLDRTQKIGKMILRNERKSALAAIDDLFNKLQSSMSLIPMFPKYITMDIIRTSLEKRTEDTMLLNYMYEIGASSNISQLREICNRFVMSDNRTEESSRKVVDEAVNIIHKEYMNNISLESVAERVFLSPSYLSYLFKKQMGQSFMKYQTNYRIEMAKNLLRTTGLKIGSICEMVGYANVSYFCLIFKNYTGMTPAQYRENEL